MPTQPRMDAHSNSPTMTSTTISQMTIHSSLALCAVFLWSRNMSSISCSTYIHSSPHPSLSICKQSQDVGGGLLG